MSRATSTTLANADEMPRDQNPIFLKAENRFESMRDSCSFLRSDSNDLVRRSNRQVSERPHIWRDGRLLSA
jgi:pSer/pThr/pTyr-binding forkhead associated (FHA) protein